MMKKKKNTQLHILNETQNEAPMSALNTENTPKIHTEEVFDKRKIQKNNDPQKWKGILCILLSAFFFSLMSVFVKLSGDLPVFQKALLQWFLQFLFLHSQQLLKI